MEFLNLNVFYFMMIPLVLLYILIITSKTTFDKYFSKEISNKLKITNQHFSKNTRNNILFFVLILFIVAMSRPVIDKKEQKVKQSLIPIVIALDVSTSMLSEDIYPNRIALAKKKLQSIIEKAKNTTIGVVLFAKDSFILSPVTEDFISLKYIVDNLNTNLNFPNGSNIFSTLEATNYMLADYKVKNLIILSDGGNDNKYSDELEFAKENSIVIYSIGLATKDGAPIPKDGVYLTNKNGDIVTVKLNESIKNLSMQSGGGFIEYSIDAVDIDAIINRINIQSKKEEVSIKKVKTYTELFYYPLGLGIFLLLIAFSSLPSRKNTNSTKSIVLFLLVSVYFTFPVKTFAYTFNFENIENATNLYNAQKYKESSDMFRKVSASNESLYNLGNSLYKEKKYQESVDVYNKIITNDKNLESKKLHNLGNSYVQLNKLKKAKEFYEKSLKIKEDKETKENLEMVNKELKKEKQKKNQQQKNKKKNQKSKDDKENNQENKQKKNVKKDSQKEQKKANKDKKDLEKKEQKNNKSKKDQTKNSKQGNDTVKQKELSDLEEKKWMKLLNNQKMPIYMQKMKTNKESRYDEEQPW